MRNKKWGIVIAGFAAGAVNGLFGGGGGMVLIPLLTMFSDIGDTGLFHSSIAIILPISFVSLFSGGIANIPWTESIPWLISGTIGGFLAVKLGKKIPVLWLHRGLGAMILYGGIRYLC